MTNQAIIKYTTTILYQTIFESIIHLLFNYIQSDLLNEEPDEIEEYSTAYIDNILNNNLIYKENFWYIKEDNATN